MYDLLIRKARMLDSHELVDIGIRDGVIVEIAPHSHEKAKEEIDAKENVLLPPFVESHIHLDSVLTAGEPRYNESGTLFEGIQVWTERKSSLSVEDVMKRALVALKWQVAQGILHVRTHVDVCDPNLTALKALLKVRESVAPYLQLQIVAFPQEGILSYEGGTELLEEALRLGADVVGAIPHYEYTREMGIDSLHTCFNLAQKYERLIDVHCDEIDDEQSRFVETVAALALQTGLHERVTASHTTAMHSYNGAYAYKLLRLIKKSRINMVANPLINITLQGRFDSYPTRRGVTRIKEMWQSGINVSLGHDDILDPWYPLGTGSMLQVAHMAVHTSHLTGMQEIAETLQMVTNRAARTLNIESSYGIDVGKPASLLLVPGENAFDLIRRQPLPRYVISRGRVVATTEPAVTTVFTERMEQVDFRKPSAWTNSL
ncbi:cytosine deaminase [Sulfoacidibacillus thermotolerans]|nr:cytosine deaminase [Sulfoacidibacillus thermotolerans]